MQLLFKTRFSRRNNISRDIHYNTHIKWNTTGEYILLKI